MPKVRDVLERAYGAIPEGATCHVGAFYNDGQFFSVGGFSVRTPYLEPVYAASNLQQFVPRNALGNQWNVVVLTGEPIGIDISDQPAEAFSPVFQCAAYDAALDALRKEGVDPRNVIALADAWSVADLQHKLAPTDDQAYERASEAKERFKKASREFWASLSADGTGKSPVLSTHLDVMGEGK